MKMNYPIEAFALAMIMFSSNIQDALIYGIIILFITTLGLLINECLEGVIPKWSRVLSVIILILAIDYSVFRLVSLFVFGSSPDLQTTFLQIVIGGLILKHILLENKTVDYDRLLYEGAGAYASLFIISLLREFLSNGAMNGVEIANFGFMARNFQSVAIALLFAAIAFAILNRIYHYENTKPEGIFVVLPVLIVSRPFTFIEMNEILSSIIGIAVAILCFLSIRQTLVFSRLSKEWKRLPIELLSTSFIYMILASFQ